MGPQRKRQRGLLGVEVDSEDSDYAPSDDCSGGNDAARSSSTRRRAKTAAGDAVATRAPPPRQPYPGGDAADSGAPPAAGWASLPTPLVAQIFQAVCTRGALPMAPRLACVCSRWRSAVAETPELWRLLNTAKLPARAGRAAAAAAGGARGRGKGGSAKTKAKRGSGGSSSIAGSSGRPPASVGLQGWVETGRLDQLQQLLLAYDDADLAGDDYAGAFFADAQSAQATCGAASGAAGLDAAALRLLGGRCSQLRSLAIEGPPPLHAEELASVLLAMPQLSELRLSGVRIMPQRGVDAAVRRLLDAAVETGRPALTSLVLEGCPLLGAKALRGLAPSPLRPAQGAAAAADGGEDSSPQQAQQAGDANGAGAGGGTLLPAAPAFPRLTQLDLSCSGGGCGLLHLQLDAMQAAMPALQVLKLTALGGFHGWVVSLRAGAALPGFPRLHTLHVGSGVLQLPSGLVRHGSSHVTDKVLLQLAGKSPLLEDVDLSGCQVTCDGLADLAAALAAHTNAAPGGAAGAASGLRLRSVDISRGRLADDDGLTMLGQLCADTLQELTARNAGMRLGDAGLRALRGCLHLTSLDLSSSAVTEEGVRDLLAALPAGVLDELLLGSCRSLSRVARQAADRGVGALREWLAANAQQP